MDAETTEEEVFPLVNADCAAIADRVESEILKGNQTGRGIDIWTEAHFAPEEDRQITFTIWYDTRDMLKEAVESGAADRLEQSIRDACVDAGFPREHLSRVKVWFDCHQAFARLLNKEQVFDSWLAEKNATTSQDDGKEGK